MYHSSTQRRQQLQDWQEALSLSLLWSRAMMLSSTKENILSSSSETALGLNPWTWNGQQGRTACCLWCMYCCTIFGILSQDTHPLWKRSQSGTSSHPYLESINIWYPSDQNAINFLVKFLTNFQRKRVEISIIYECNLKIVKICQKCANFESGSLSEKLLRIEKSSSKSYKLLKSYRGESV